jgi:transposase-like protein
MGDRRQLSAKFTAAKLTNNQALAIRLEYAKGGVTHDELAKKYGVSDSAICSIVRQQSWRDAGGPLAPSNRKLDAAAVRNIRERYSEGGYSFHQLGREHGVSAAAVKAVIYGRNWRHVK